MSDDISTKLTCDPTDFTAGMTEARSQLSKTTEAVVKDSALMRSAISGKDFVATVVADTRQFTSSVKDAAGEWNRFNSIPHESWGDVFAGISKSANRVKGDADEARSAVSRLWSTAFGIAPTSRSPASPVQTSPNGAGETPGATDETASATSRLASMTANAAVAAQTAAVAWLGYELVIKEAGSAVADHLREGAQFRSMLGNVTTSVTGLTASITGPLIEGLRGSMNAALQFTTGFGSITELIDAGAGKLTSWGNAASSMMQSAGREARGLAATFSTALFIWHKGTGNAAAFHEDGLELSKLSEETSKFIAKQEAARSSFQSLKSIQEQATQSAANASEVAKVASIMTVEGVDQQVAALREKSTATIMAGNADKAWESQTKSLFEALAKQRQGIIDGTVVDKAAEEAKKALAKATEDAAKAAAAAAQKELQQQQQGARKIESLKDQIDMLNKTATEADIAMREMFREGFAMDQVMEVGKLTAELEKLKQAEADSKKDGGTGSKVDSKTTAKAALAGTAEAASIMLRGTGGGSKMESLALRQIAVMEKVAQNTQSQEQPMLMAGSFGPGGNVS